MSRDNEFVPLDGPEVLEAVLADVKRALESRHDLFAKHISYPRVSWDFELELDFYHTQESVETSGELHAVEAGTQEKIKVETAPRRESVKDKRRVHAPDAVREELLGAKPRTKEDRGESAQLLSGPQNDGIIRISRP